MVGVLSLWGLVRIGIYRTGVQYPRGPYDSDGDGRSRESDLFTDRVFLAQTDGGHFDVIIDDGGHHYEQQSLSYEVLFDRALTPGGVYFIEDIETSYWQPGVPLYNHPITRGGYAEPDTLINRFKLVIDVGTCRRCGESCTNSMCVDVSLCSVSRVLFCQFIIISLALSYYLFVPFFCVVFSGCHRYTI